MWEWVSELLTFAQLFCAVTDADGDGVEDNVKLTHHELDQFYKPAVFKSA